MSFFRTRFLVWLCLLEAGLVGVRAQSGFLFNNQGSCCVLLEWVNNGCYPFYGNVVVIGQCCNGVSSISGGPPCQGSYIVMIGLGCATNATISNFDGSIMTLSPSGQLTVQGGGATMVNNAGSLMNNSGSTQIIGLTGNGVPTGTYLVLPPGAGGVIPWQSAPGSGTSWGWMPMPGGTVSGPSTLEPGGGTLVTGGTWTPPLIGGPFGPPGSDNPIPQFPPASTNWNIAQTNVLGTPTPPPPTSIPPFIPAYTNSPDFGSPVTWGNSTNNGTLTSGTFQQGINSLYTQDTVDSKAIVAAIQQFNSDYNYSQLPVSNYMQIQTNYLGQVSSNLAAFNANFSNFFNTNWSFNSNAATAGGAAASVSGASTLQGLGNAVAINSAINPSSPGWNVVIHGTSYNLDPLANSIVGPAAGWVRQLSQWGMYGWFLFWLFNEISVVVREAGRAPQGSAADDVPIVSSATALAMAALVTGAITVLITACTAYATNTFIQGFVSHPFNGGGGSAVQGGLYLLNGVFDIGLCLSLMASRLALQMYLTKAYFICVTAVRFLTG